MLKQIKKVLILVLMEDALAHSGKEYEVSLKFVLILVLMEDALALLRLQKTKNLYLTVLILVLMEDALAPEIGKLQ